MTEKKRYIIVMIFCVAMDVGLRDASRSLPLWLDTTGTMLAAIILEPTAALIVGLVNNFCAALLWNGPTEILYFASSAALALIVSLYMVKDRRPQIKKIIPSYFICAFSMTMISLVVTTVRFGFDTSKWNGIAFRLGDGPLSAAAGTLLTEFLDLGATFAIVFLVYLILPGSLKRKAEAAPVSRKASGDALSAVGQANRETAGDVPDTVGQASRAAVGDALNAVGQINRTAAGQKEDTQKEAADSRPDEKRPGNGGDV
ncbi:MAG TPA: hypothetical protein PLN48_00585 [Lachnospiraceae bacterium]|nr:hypothetical protein [Lachnospiraceae bacterium]